MTTLSWVLTVVFGYLAGTATTLYVGAWVYKRHVQRIADAITDLTKQ